MFRTADAEDISQVTSHDRNISPLRNARDSPENSQEAKPTRHRDITVKMLLKEMVLCVVLALTTYGALHNSPSKISNHPPAVRFFDYDSSVRDWYRGQLSHAMSAANNADVAFVMYYAPWDAESQYVRKEFDKAATVLGDIVHFSAINCWNPGSECRLSHALPSWPILIAYTVTTKGLIYKGPKDAHSMVKFLELVMKPLDRMASTEDLVSLLSTCDVVAVGYTPLTDSPKYYNVWHQVASKSLEFDIMGEICFATVTSEDLALELGVEGAPGAKLLLWNETKDYNVDLANDPTAWNVTALLNWVLDNFSQPVARIIPMWRKAYSFERYFHGSPVLMMFTPLNPLYEQLPALALLREVAMEYYDCNKNSSTHWTYELRKLQHVQRLLYEQKDFHKMCQEHNFRKTVRKQKKNVISHNNKYPWSNTTKIQKQKTGLFQTLEKRGLSISKVLETVDDADFGILEECPKVFPAEKSYYDNYGQCISYEDSVGNGQYGKSTSMLPLEDDPLTADNLLQEKMRHFCKIFAFANEWGPIIKPKHVDGNITSIQGLACSWNQSLNFIAVDSVRNHHMAESLGIDVMNRKDYTAVVILDSKQETQYLLPEELSAKSLRDFILNFTRSNVRRYLRTRVEQATHTHHFGSEGVTEQMELNESTIHVADLTTKTFRKFIRTPGTLSMIAVCGGVCPAHTTRSLLTATRLLAACGVQARAARIDALRHDLPWHFTASNYPAILAFNTKKYVLRDRDPDSRSLSPKTRISAASLIALALRSLGAPHSLRVRLALCANTQVTSAKKICIKDLREHVMTLINRNLKYWRRTDDRKLKQAFLIRLQRLRQISLDLSLVHISDLNEDSVQQSNLSNSLDILSQNWDKFPIITVSGHTSNS